VLGLAPVFLLLLLLLLLPLEEEPCSDKHRLSLCGVADAKAQLKRCSWQ
jgi:hypothetical protein